MILDDIVRDKRIDLQVRKQEATLADLMSLSLYREPRRGFRDALHCRSRAIIAEVKKASPSKGLIRGDFDPVWIAKRYAECGAAAVSVLTEERYFQGSLAYLAAIRGVVDVPLLRKDFLFDPYQLHEARAFGADAVLLIVAMLEDAELEALSRTAAELDLAVLVEVHDGRELERAIRQGASIIGINNRDLRSFHTTLATTERLAPAAPAGAMVVAESGIDTVDDIARMERAGVHCFLIGESLMRAEDPGAKLAELLKAP